MMHKKGTSTKTIVMRKKTKNIIHLNKLESNRIFLLFKLLT